MKCAFVYFSGTGITPKYAYEIAKGIISKEICIFDFIRLKKGKEFNLSSYDVIGIGAPSYSFHAPRLATRLIRRMNFQRKPFFVFATYNTKAGNTLWNLYRAVKRSAGICLGFQQGSITVNIRAWKPKIRSGKKLKEIPEVVNNQATEFGIALTKRYKNWIRNPKQTQNKFWIPPKKISVIIWSAFLTWNWQMLLTVGFKHVDKKKCTRCDLCATTICPSEAIRMNDKGFPKFVERKCIGCNGCVNLCPTDAIWTCQTKNRLPYDLYKEFILEEETIAIEE